SYCRNLPGPFIQPAREARTGGTGSAQRNPPRARRSSSTPPPTNTTFRRLAPHATTTTAAEFPLSPTQHATHPMAPPDSISTRSSLPLAATPMTDPAPSPPASAAPPPNPLAAASSFLHHHLSRLASHLTAPRPALAATASPRAPGPQGASLSLALAPDEVARSLTGTPVFTVCNSNNEFVLVSDPATGLRSLGLLCFRSEDADALLTHVRTRQPVLGRGAKVVPITLDQVYMLKAEGIAFRFLPDPLQIKNALELKSGLTAFDGVPVFQSDLLVVKKQKRYCPIYFQKEDIERELTKASKSSRGSALSKQIMVGSLEDVLKKMEINERNSGWDDLIFIPPGKSLNQHINEVSA
ncbi:unnamed protein product, partial [Urochloa humidicola]